MYKWIPNRTIHLTEDWAKPDVPIHTRAWDQHNQINRVGISNSNYCTCTRGCSVNSFLQVFSLPFVKHLQLDKVLGIIIKTRNKTLTNTRHMQLYT